MLRNPIMLSPSETSAFEDYHKLKEKYSQSPQSDPEMSSMAKSRRSASFGGKSQLSRSVSFDPGKNFVIGTEGGKEYFYECENDKLLSKPPPPPPTAAAPIEKAEDVDDEDLQILPEEEDDGDETTDRNTQFNANLRNFIIEKDPSKKKAEQAEEIDPEVSNILHSRHSIEAIDAIQKTSPGTSKDPVVPLPRKPKPVKLPTPLAIPSAAQKLPPTHSSAPLEATTFQLVTESNPLMKSQSAVSASMRREDYTLSLAHDASVHKTMIALKGDGSQRLHHPQHSSTRPDFVPPLILTQGAVERILENGEVESLPASGSNRASISPSPGRDLSEISSNLSSTRSGSPDELSHHHHHHQHQHHQHGPISRTYTGKKTGKVNTETDAKLRSIGKDLEAAAIRNRHLPAAPRRQAPPLPPRTYLINATQPTIVDARTIKENGVLNGGRNILMQKSISSSAVSSIVNGHHALSGGGPVGAEVIDISVCKHMARSRIAPQRSASQDRGHGGLVLVQNYGKANSVVAAESMKPRPRKRFSSLRRLFPKFERSPSQPVTNGGGGGGGLRKSTGGNRSSFSFAPQPAGKTNECKVVPGDGVPGLFHSMYEPCTAAEHAVNGARAEVTVTDISEPISVTIRTAPAANQAAPNRDSTPLASCNQAHSTTASSQQQQSTAVSTNSSATTPSSGTSSNPPAKVKRESSVTGGNNISHKTQAACQLLKSSSVDIRQFGSQSHLTNGHHHDNGKKVEHQPTEKRKLMEDRYNQMALSHMSTLAFVAEHFGDLAAKWRDCLPASVPAEELRWSHLKLVTPVSPILVKETAVFYRAQVVTSSSPTDVPSTPQFVNVMISPVRYTNPLPRNSASQPFFLPTLAEFQEQIPSKLLRLTCLEEDSGSEADGVDGVDNSVTVCKITVLPPVRLVSIDSFADQTASRHHPLKLPTLHEKETCFILIQLIAALKCLQSQGIEEVGTDMEGFLLLLPAPEKQQKKLVANPSPPQVVLLWDSFFATDDSSGDNGMGCNGVVNGGIKRFLSLCQAALAALCMVLHTDVPTQELLREGHVPLFPRVSVYSEGFQKVAEILHQEKASSLTQAKALLEHMFWVSCPQHLSFTNISNSCGDLLSNDDSDNSGGGKCNNNNSTPAVRFDSEFNARLWLDMERARTVSRLVRSMLQDRKSLDLVEEYRVQYLLHVSAKQLFECATALEVHREVVV